MGLRTWDNEIQKHKEKQKLKDDTHPLLPPTHPNIDEPFPTYPIPHYF